MRNLLLGMLALLAAAPTVALAEGSRGGVYLGPLIDTTFGFGTDFYHYNGSISPGDTLAFAGGIHVRPYRTSRFDLRATVGYSVAAGSESDYDNYIDCLTTTVMPSWRFAGNWWVGAGAEVHSNIKLRNDDGDPLTTFDTAVGPTFDLGWHFHGGRVFEGVIAGFATLMDYDYGVGKVGADSFGLRLTALFGWSLGGDERPAPVATPVWKPAATPPARAPGPMPPAPAAAPAPDRTYTVPSSNPNVGGTRYRGGSSAPAPEPPPQPKP